MSFQQTPGTGKTPPRSEPSLGILLLLLAAFVLLAAASLTIDEKNAEVVGVSDRRAAPVAEPEEESEDPENP